MYPCVPQLRAAPVSAVIAGVMGFCGSAHAQLPTTQNFDTAGTNFTLTNFGGTAGSEQSGGPSGDFFRITPAAGGSQNTLAFDRTTAGSNIESITATFDFRMDGSADGMGFVLLNTANHGATGAGPAISEDPNVAGSFGLGFDIFNNGGPDPNNNHLSLHLNGAQVAGGAFGDPGLDISNGVFNRANVLIDFIAGGANVTVQITPDVFGTPGATITPINGFFISGFNPYENRVAFGARTGGAVSNHDVDNINVSYVLTANAVAPEPGTLALIALGGALPLALAIRRHRSNG